MGDCNSAKGQFQMRGVICTVLAGNKGGVVIPLIPNELHLRDFDALLRAHFYTTHATNALSCLKGISLAVRAHLVNLNRTDVYAFSTAGAALHVDAN